MTISQNYNHEAVESRLSPEKVCCHSFQKTVSSNLPSATIRVMAHSRRIVSVLSLSAFIFYLTLTEGHRQGPFTQGKGSRREFGQDDGVRESESERLVDLYLCRGSRPFRGQNLKIIGGEAFVSAQLSANRTMQEVISREYVTNSQKK